MTKLSIKHKSLAEERPDLLKEWDYEKNNELGIYPDKVSCGSNKKVCWKCSKCGNKWSSGIYNRNKGHGCPECAKKKVALANSLPKDGKSLQESFPDLLKEWNYKENDRFGIFPNNVKPGSSKRVWWKCSVCGHEWKTSISHRCLRNTGCPKCSAIYKTSFPEQAIYYFLDMIFLGEVKNRYKLKDEKGFIEADIYLPNKNVVIEYDGKYWHKDKQEKDLEKEYRCKALKKHFIRIVEYNENKVIDNCIFYNSFKNRDENLTWAIQELFTMLDVSCLFVNVLSFKDKILEFYHKNEIKGNLAVLNLELAKEWNYEKNGNLKPTMFSCGSHEKVWWKCSICGHEWETKISHRNNGIGCPKCATNRVGFKNSLPSYGDSLEDRFPDLLKEWNYEKNSDLNPNIIAYSSNKSIWWKCNTCGHEWQAPVNRRTSNKSGCAKCAKIRIGKLRAIPARGQSLQEQKPLLIKEWNFEKNNNLLPSEVSYGSNKKVWWKCPICMTEWQAVIASRSKGFGGCPECAKKNQKKKK